MPAVVFREMSVCFDGKTELELIARHRELKAEMPWLKDQHYFKTCRMTRLALMKIWSHAHEGALNIENGTPSEIIGILLGYVADEAVSDPNMLTRLSTNASNSFFLFRSLSQTSSKALILEQATQLWCLIPV